MLKSKARLIRFVLGLLMAVFLGIDSAMADRGLMLILLLPLAIVLLVASDYLGESNNKQATA